MVGHDDRNGSRDQTRRLAGIALVAALASVFVLTLAPLLPALLWGGTLAIAVAPWHRRLTARFDGRKSLASAAFAAGMAMVFVIPAIGISQALLALVPDALALLEASKTASPAALPSWLVEMPVVGASLQSLWREVAEDTAQVAAQFEAEIAAALVFLMHEANLFAIFVFEFAVGVLLAVMALQNAESLAPLCHRFFDRIGGAFGTRMMSTSVDTLRHSVRGALGAAVAQTFAATLAYVIVDIDHWVILSTITLFLALTPVGPALVWAPLGLWFLLQGDWASGAFLMLWGGVIVSLTDNIVRPMLVSRASGLPPSLAFIGALGGLLAWGVVGMFLGPAVVAVVREILLQWIMLDERRLEDAAPAGSGRSGASGL